MVVRELLISFVTLALLASTASALVMINHLKTTQTSPVHVRVSSQLDLEKHEPEDDIKIVAMIPELALRVNDKFRPRSSRIVNRALILTLPDDINKVPPSTELWIRYYVRTENGKTRVKHRPIIIQ